VHICSFLIPQAGVQPFSRPQCGDLIASSETARVPPETLILAAGSVFLNHLSALVDFQIPDLEPITAFWNLGL